MKIRKESKIFFNQQGRLYEIQILAFFFAIGLAIFIPGVQKYGFGKALGHTVVILAIVMGGLLAFLLFLGGIGWLWERIIQAQPRKKDPPAPDQSEKH